MVREISRLIYMIYKIQSVACQTMVFLLNEPFLQFKGKVLFDIQTFSVLYKHVLLILQSCHVTESNVRSKQ